MRKLWKGMLLGGVVGAGVAGVQAARSGEDSEVARARVLKAAGQGAVLGALVGWWLDRRDAKRLASQAATGVSAVLAKATHVAETALDRAGHAADVARPKVIHAAESARERATHATETARERATHAAETARERAGHAADVARPKVIQAAETARERAAHAAEAARERAAQAADRAGQAAGASSARVVDVFENGRRFVIDDSADRTPVIVNV